MPRPAQVQLRPITWTAVIAIVGGQRLADWAEDFPDGGSVTIARMLERRGAAALEAAPWGHRHIVEMATGLVVGGAGFHGPPQDDVVEVGYGVVPSRRGRGYATEAVLALLQHAWSDAQIRAVVAGTDVVNVPSQRVLQKAGFGRDAEAERRHTSGMLRWRIDRP